MQVVILDWCLSKERKSFVMMAHEQPQNMFVQTLGTPRARLLKDCCVAGLAFSNVRLSHSRRLGSLRRNPGSQGRTIVLFVATNGVSESCDVITNLQRCNDIRQLNPNIKMRKENMREITVGHQVERNLAVKVGPPCTSHENGGYATSQHHD